MNTKEIMDIILKCAGLDEMPEDTGIFFEGEGIKKIMAGIDIDTSDILLSKELGVDMVMVHHPVSGSPRINLHKVMNNQIKKMVEAGVPINKAQKALKERKNQVLRNKNVSNFDKVSSAARLLKIPFIGVHSPADIISERRVQDHLDNKFKGRHDIKLKEIITALNQIEEYALSIAKPIITVGSEEDYAGKILVTMAGGTGGGPLVYKALFEAGVGTLIVMHANEDVIKEVKEQNIGNIIVAGHMSSDSIGMNIILDKLEEKGLEIIRMAGIIGDKLKYQRGCTKIIKGV